MQDTATECVTWGSRKITRMPQITRAFCLLLLVKCERHCWRNITFSPFLSDEVLINSYPSTKSRGLITLYFGGAFPAGLIKSTNFTHTTIGRLTYTRSERWVRTIKNPATKAVAREKALKAKTEEARQRGRCLSTFATFWYVERT